MFYEQSYNAFPTWLSFITKLNSNQLNIIKNKIDEDNFGKKISQKKKTQKKLEKTMWEKTVSIHGVLWGKTCNCNS